MSNSVNLTPEFSLSAFLDGGEIVAFNVGLDGTAYVVVALRPLDYRIQRSSSSFARIVPAVPQSYRVVGWSNGEVVLDLRIENERFNIHDVQPLGERLLLVSGRSRYRDPDDFDKNGRVYNREGSLEREILLGDGIQSVQTTSAGLIWTSYFDEGVFGNYGWEQPVGAAGLVAWDQEGTKLYEFEPTNGLDFICDCYALNVSSDDDVWLYYYTEFPLVHLNSRCVRSSWKVPVSGSHAFAISQRYALFAGGYKQREIYHLFRLGSERLELISKFKFRENDRKLNPSTVVGRGSCLWLLDDARVFRVDVEALAGM